MPAKPKPTNPAAKGSQDSQDSQEPKEFGPVKEPADGPYLEKDRDRFGRGISQDEVPGDLDE